MVSVSTGTVRCLQGGGVMVSVASALIPALVFLVPAFGLDVPGTCSYNPLFLEGTCSARYTDVAAVLIQTVYATIAEADCELANPCSFPPDYCPGDWEEFDFIVVGAGSGGSVVANRLSEISGWTVLLLEAGGNPPKTTEVPALNRLLWDTNVDWQFKTDSEEPNCLSSVGSRCKWPRGKMLGGSSSMNGLRYVRGNRRDYDGWESQGNTGWGYEDVLPYFKKSEDMRSQRVRCTPDFSKYHGTGGPLKIDDFNVRRYEPLLDLMGLGFAELGYPYNPDTNGDFQSGYCWETGTIEEGRRCSTAKAFLSPIRGRPNFKLSRNSLVTKILIDENTKVAYGVEFLNKNGNIVRVLARKEVIVSGGTVNSPQLLMLSGIGPRHHLAEHGITAIADLPVGRNLQDHHYIFGLVISFDYMLTEDDNIRNMFNFLIKNNRQSFSSQGFCLLMNSCPDGIDNPDVQVYFSYNNRNSSTLLQPFDTLGYNDEVKQRVQELNRYKASLFMNPMLVNIKSRGYIQLESKNPTYYPKIAPGYFSDPRDVDSLINTIKFLRQLAYTEPFKAFGATFHEIKLNNCLRFAPDSRPYWECFLRHMVITGGHFVGTCSMGPPGHPGAVVDPQLRVQGVGRLRVIDASVMPTVPHGNTNAPTIMIAEKGSDFIKHTWLSTPYNGAQGFKNTLNQGDWYNPEFVY